VAGAVAQRVLAPRPAEPVRRAALRTAGRRAFRLGLAGPALAGGQASWYPLTTFVLTLMDVKNAMNVTPGRFAARGHDYRADLARMVSETYHLPVTDDELLAIEHALRRREAEWAKRRLIAEQLRRAKEAVQRQTKACGLADEISPVSPGLA